MAWVEGCLERVVWASARNSYAVLQLDLGEEIVSAVGELGLVAEQDLGSFVALEGEWETHSVHGKQFRATGFLQGSPRTLVGLKLYLGSAGIPGVGPKLAERIVDAFGMATLDVLANDPDQLCIVEGLGPKRAAVIQERWRIDEEGRAITITLRGLGLSNRLVQKVRDRYRERTAEVVMRQPYRLAEEISGIGFRTADQLARLQGLPDDHPDRVRAAVVHVLEQATNDGDCFLPEPELTQAIRSLGVPIEGVPAAIERAVEDGAVVVEGGEPRRIWRSGLHGSEEFVARELIQRATTQGSLDFDADARIRAAEAAEGLQLDDSQREAVKTALNGGVLVVTGGPGTGKTTILKVLLKAAGADDWHLASPTGRAAKRLGEATGRTAQTLHRLLEFNPGEGGFQRKVSNPLEGSGLIVDEASMLDLELLQALLEALPYPAPDFSLVFVGDADQLPSVGAGEVLRDIIDSGVVPVARLTQVHRQAAQSGIVRAAHRIRNAELPQKGDKGGDFFLLERENADAAVQTLVTVVGERLPALGFGPDAIQVLTPVRKGPLGTQALNRTLQQHLNPRGEVLTESDPPMRQGDRVICTKNNYDLEVFNGDLGTVLSKNSEGLVVDVDGRKVAWPWDELRSLELAYAITVHKSQGSEYPAVVFVLHASHGIMLRRNLFYTGVTRAKRFLCVLGSERGWRRAVGSAGHRERHTGLAQRLRDFQAS